MVKTSLATDTVNHIINKKCLVPITLSKILENLFVLNNKQIHYLKELLT